MLGIDDDTEAAVRELSVVGVRVELPSNQPIVLLREVEGDRYLPIWIGAVEATAIAYEQQGVKPARPLTHDLLRDVLAALKAPLQAVEIVELKENVFYADLLIGDDLRVSARPSDSIALALRVGAPIRCAEQVLTEAGIVIPDEQEDEVEKFREFLEQVRPGGFRRLSPARGSPCGGVSVSKLPAVTLELRYRVAESMGVTPPVRWAPRWRGGMPHARAS